MKKLALCALFILCLSILTSCTAKPSPPPDSQLTLIGDDVTEIDCTHLLMGKSTQWTVRDADLEALRTWANALEYEIRDFPKGSTPGDAEGQETYSFSPSTGSPFTYIICGPTQHYLLIESNWYSLKTPSPPPFDTP